LFGDIGYGLDALGTEESLRSIDVAAVRAFHQKLAVPNNCVLAIYGDIKPLEVKAAVEKAFRAWQPAPFETFDLMAVNQSPDLSSVKRVTSTRDKKQAVVLLGYRAATLFTEDRYALELLQESCSDLGSRLFLRIREQLGLAYYVGAQHAPGLVPGYFAFYAGTMPEKAEIVEQELLREAELLRTDGLTEIELKRGKAKMVGQRKIARQDIGALALTGALDELYVLGYAHSDTEDARFEVVTLEQVKAAAQKYLTPEAMVISVIKGVGAA